MPTPPDVPSPASSVSPLSSPALTDNSRLVISAQPRPARDDQSSRATTSPPRPTSRAFSVPAATPPSRVKPRRAHPTCRPDPTPATPPPTQAEPALPATTSRDRPAQATAIRLVQPQPRQVSPRLRDLPRPARAALLSPTTHSRPTRFSPCRHALTGRVRPRPLLTPQSDLPDRVRPPPAPRPIPTCLPTPTHALSCRHPSPAPPRPLLHSPTSRSDASRHTTSLSDLSCLVPHTSRPADFPAPAVSVRPLPCRTKRPRHRCGRGLLGCRKGEVE